MHNDTICAIVTAAGAASVGIIRISGPQSISIANKIFKGKESLLDVKTHTISYGKIFNNYENKYIDEALLLVMKKPRSFTGEDIVEIQCHGGYITMKNILKLCLFNGCRMAEPGEFSKRAFLNGKLDLAQAESIMDIVNAKTEKGLDIAVNQLQGSLSKEILKIKDEVLRLIAFVEADIDFPEEDIERLSPDEIHKKCLIIKNDINKILLTSNKGKIINEGLNIVIIGKPNVGKSSLLNALLKEDRAIVTDVPGTTRDAIEEFINLAGIPIKIIDTAGIRETNDLVEKIGVEKAKEFIKKADLVLYVIDVISGLTSEDTELLTKYLDEIPTIVLVNKIDIINEKYKQIEIKNNIKYVEISAKENKGLVELENEISNLFFNGKIEISNDIIVTNVRHVNSLKNALEYIEAVIDSVEKNMPGDFLTIDLRSCWESLGEIIGDTVEENILDKIFSQFCLGK